jgi:hypothetical protein
MSTDVRQPRCPLCDALVADDDSLREHLAAVHDLEDDPGTRSTIGHLERDTILMAHEPGSVLAATHAPPALRVYDPAPDDERWRPIAIGFGGLLLLILTVIALTVQL